MKSKLKQENKSKSGHEHLRQRSKYALHVKTYRVKEPERKIEATEMWDHKNKTRNKVDDETKTVTQTKWHNHTHAHGLIREPEPVTETTELGNFLCSRNTQSQSSRLIREWGLRNLNRLRSSDLKKTQNTQHIAAPNVDDRFQVVLRWARRTGREGICWEASISSAAKYYWCFEQISNFGQILQVWLLERQTRRRYWRSFLIFSQSQTAWSLPLAGNPIMGGRSGR